MDDKKFAFEIPEKAELPKTPKKQKKPIISVKRQKLYVYPKHKDVVMNPEFVLTMTFVVILLATIMFKEQIKDLLRSLFNADFPEPFTGTFD